MAVWFTGAVFGLAVGPAPGAAFAISAKGVTGNMEFT